ncbi:hypothetical protein G9A89_014630 [Geosiphon pyriformis]|nr:hypothetical protein G9A89_014630 [Geosiphon pyriformis]
MLSYLNLKSSLGTLTFSKLSLKNQCSSNVSNNFLVRLNSNLRIYHQLPLPSYTSRNVFTNNRTSIQRFPPGKVENYKRFPHAKPFYEKQIFWVSTGVVGSLTGADIRTSNLRLTRVYYYTHLETVPLTGRRRFMDVSPKQEELIAQQAYREIMSQFHNKILPTWYPESKFVRQVAQRLVKVSGMQSLYHCIINRLRKFFLTSFVPWILFSPYSILKSPTFTDLNWEFYVISSPEKNAFVLPGGKVFVFTGILPITKNEDGMAAVLGHEIGHQIARHSAEKLSVFKILLLTQILVSMIFDPSLLTRLFFELGIM